MYGHLIVSSRDGIPMGVRHNSRAQQNKTKRYGKQNNPRGYVQIDDRQRQMDRGKGSPLSNLL